MTTLRMFGGREQLIALLLRYGTWIATAIIGIGILAELLGYRDPGATRAGIAMFILLPIARVILMLAIFVRERDHVYVALSALVLAIIAVSIIAGLQAP